MEIADSFRVSTPIRDTWKVLLDIEGIAPCMPGAQLQEVEGNEYRGVVKVKVGPITAQYKGTATLVDVDEAAHRILIDAAGRDTRGQGNANASIVVSMTEDGDGTIVEVVTDLAITGKVAQFGRGVLDDVSAKLLRQFVDNLERDVLSNSDATIENPPRVSEPEPTPFASDESPASNGTTASGPRRIDSAEAEPIDLLEMAGGSAAGRLVPIAIAALVLLVAWRLLRHRS
jgi:uncharacterized protein